MIFDGPVKLGPPPLLFLHLILDIKLITTLPKPIEEFLILLW